MKHGFGYEIDFVNQKIILTKSFAAKAGTIESAEYTMLLEVRKNFPEFKIELREIAKKAGKKTYAKLTYDNMRMYITTVFGKNSDQLKELENVIKVSKSLSGKYAYVKSWFLEKFPHYDELTAV